MTVNYTTLLRLVQPVTGTESGTWGDYVNNAFSAYADAAISGTQTLSSDANATLTLTEGTNSATNLGSTSAQYAILNLTGSRSTTRTVTLPTSSRSYIVHNNTTGSATTVGGVSVAVGERCILTYDTNTSAYVKTASSISDVGSVTGTLGVANGGTGAASLTANNVILGNGTSAVQVVAPSTTGNVLTSNGTTWTSAAPASPGIGADVFTTGTSASYTIPAGITKIKVTVIGGGGGGAGTQSGCPGSNGGGGGGGGSSIVYLTGLTPGGTITYTVGTGGTAGAIDANGGSGGTSSITVSATTYSATGGSGGTFIGGGGAGGNSSGTAGAVTSKGGGGGSAFVGGSGGGTILSPTGDAAGRGGGGRGSTGTGSTAGVAGVIIFEY